MRSRTIPLIVFLFLATIDLCAQDSTRTQEPVNLSDSAAIRQSGQEITSVIPPYVPRKALLLSAVFPGLGQAYNAKYWKMPIVYGGFIGFGYMISYYNELYTTFKTEYYRSLEDPSYIPPSGASQTQLSSLVDRTRRERDYMMVLTGLFYFLQIADAHIDAHLREFDLNPDLQVRLGPSFDNQGPTQVYGMGISLKF